MILTAGRTGEVIGAKWSEIDLGTDVWTVPADRMKAGREHKVPQCARALAILGSIGCNCDPNKFVFPGWRAGTGLSTGAMLALMRKMKFGH